MARGPKKSTYKSKMFRKGQIHPSFPHVIINKKSFNNPFEFFNYTFRLKGTHERKVSIIKSMLNFMDQLEQEEVDFSTTGSYFPLFVLEARNLLKLHNGIFKLKEKGRLWQEGMQEAIELYGHYDHESYMAELEKQYNFNR